MKTAVGIPNIPFYFDTSGGQSFNGKESPVNRVLGGSTHPS